MKFPESCAPWSAASGEQETPKDSIKGELVVRRRRTIIENYPPPIGGNILLDPTQYNSVCSLHAVLFTPMNMRPVLLKNDQMIKGGGHTLDLLGRNSDQTKSRFSLFWITMIRHRWGTGLTMDYSWDRKTGQLQSGSRDCNLIICVSIWVFFKVCTCA